MGGRAPNRRTFRDQLKTWENGDRRSHPTTRHRTQRPVGLTSSYWGVSGYESQPIKNSKQDAAENEFLVISEEDAIELAKKRVDKVGNLADAITILNQIEELGLKTAFQKGGYRYAEYKGKTYLIFKGTPGLRKTLRLPKYSINAISKSKSVTISISKLALDSAGVAKNAKLSGWLTFVFVGAVEVIEYCLNDSETMSDLVVDLSSAAAKAAVSTAAAWAAGLIVLKFAAGAAAPPILAGLVVGYVVAELLNEVDEQGQVTQEVKKFVREMQEQAKKAAEEAERTYRWYNSWQGIHDLIRTLSR